MHEHDRPAPPVDAEESRLLDALSLVALRVDNDRRVTLVNDAAAEFLGTTRAHLLGLSVVDLLFDTPEHGPAHEVITKVLNGERWQGELQVRGRDGARAASLSAAPVLDGGAVTGALIVIDDTMSSQRRAHRLTDRLTRLARVTAELLQADDLPTVTTIVIQHMADAAGATLASLSLLIDTDRLRLIGIHGGKADAMSRWATFPVKGTPAGDAVTSGRPLVLVGQDEIHARYPELERAAAGERTMVCLPLMSGGRPIGAATMSFPGRREFDGAELDFFGVMADTCAQAIDRVQALADAADQAAKLTFLADASEELASSLDYEATLTNVARLAVPHFADWCSIALDADGGLRTLAVAHVDPEKVALALEFDKRYPADPDAPSGSYQVFRTGLSELTPEITDEMIEAAGLEPEQVALIQQLNLRSAMTVPLIANGRVLGVITWVAGGEGRRFDARDLAFGEDLARRAAVAIDNAELHTELREMAIRLQRAVLPDDTFAVPGWDLAAHYSPAGHLDAGGDFYDVIPLDRGRVAIFVGDVMGRGVHAAAAMAQMRATIRALVAVDPEPGEVLARLDMIFEHYDLNQLVTMVYAVLDPENDRVTIANAGHLPPIRIRADRTVEQLAVREDVLLGAGASVRASVTLPFMDGDVLLAFTDGLIERRNEDIDVGQRRLLAVAGRLGDEVTVAALDALVAEVTDPIRDDDVAALVVRRSRH